LPGRRGRVGPIRWLVAAPRCSASVMGPAALRPGRYGSSLRAAAPADRGFRPAPKEAATTCFPTARQRNSGRDFATLTSTSLFLWASACDHGELGPRARYGLTYRFERPWPRPGPVQGAAADYVLRSAGIHVYVNNNATLIKALITKWLCPLVLLITALFKTDGAQLFSWLSQNKRLSMICKRNYSYDIAQIRIHTCLPNIMQLGLDVGFWFINFVLFRWSFKRLAFIRASCLYFIHYFFPFFSLFFLKAAIQL
jgi:hypothetical protein